MTIPESTLEKFRAIEIAADGLVAIEVKPDSDDVIVHASQGACEVLGYRHGELIGKPLSVLLPRQYRMGHPGWVDTFVRTREIKGVMNTRSIAALGGDVQPVELRGIPEIIDGYGIVALVDPRPHVEVVRQVVQRYADPVPD